MDLQSADALQRELDQETPAENEAKRDRSQLMGAMDTINGRYGKGTVHTASTGKVEPLREWDKCKSARQCLIDAFVHGIEPPTRGCSVGIPATSVGTTDFRPHGDCAAQPLEIPLHPPLHRKVEEVKEKEFATKLVANSSVTVDFFFW